MLPRTSSIGPALAPAGSIAAPTQAATAVAIEILVSLPRTYRPSQEVAQID
jgi:hypothetical protein